MSVHQLGQLPSMTLPEGLQSSEEGKAKKSDKRALLAQKVEGRPKRGGELMANPNAAMASATLMRRGKERMDGKKKKTHDKTEENHSRVQSK